MAGELSKRRCPKCGSSLLVEDDVAWCSFVGDEREPSCGYREEGMTYQIHWHRHDVEKCEHEYQFVAQCNSREVEASGGTVEAWITGQLAEKKHLCPEGFVPVVLWENHPRMMMAAESK